MYELFLHARHVIGRIENELMHFVKMSRNYFFAIGDMKGGFSEMSHLVCTDFVNKGVAVFCALFADSERRKVRGGGVIKRK